MQEFQFKWTVVFKSINTAAKPCVCVKTATYIPLLVGTSGRNWCVIWCSHYGGGDACWSASTWFDFTVMKYILRNNNLTCVWISAFHSISALHIWFVWPVGLRFVHKSVVKTLSNEYVSSSTAGIKCRHTGIHSVFTTPTLHTVHVYLQ